MTQHETDEQRAARLEKQIAEDQAAWNKFATFSRGGWSSASEWQQGQMEVELGRPRVTNEEKGWLEAYRFEHSRPEAYTAYLASDGKSLTTFPGQTLTRTISGLTPRRVGFGGAERLYFRAVGINGVSYWGFAMGRGAYARMYAMKNEAR